MQSLLFARLDRWRVPAPSPERVEWMAQWAYAHRGLHGMGLPENSPAAFAAAIAQGMGIECDVQRSADGQAMVFHDEELDRLTGEGGPVALRSAAELGRIVLSGGSDPIPTLQAVLGQIAGQVPLLIEIKSSQETDRRVGGICLAVRRVLEGYIGPHAIMSFDPRVVRWFAERSPLTVRGLVVTEKSAVPLLDMVRRRLAMWHARPDFLAYDIRNLPNRFVAAQRRRGLPVLTWTVDNEDLAERAAIHADAPIAEGAGIA
jgi:glycerophosphoryl diester phosphodiesterase